MMDTFALKLTTAAVFVWPERQEAAGRRDGWLRG